MQAKAGPQMGFISTKETYLKQENLIHGFLCSTKIVHWYVDLQIDFSARARITDNQAPFFLP